MAPLEDGELVAQDQKPTSSSARVLRLDRIAASRAVTLSRKLVDVIIPTRKLNRHNEYGVFGKDNFRRIATRYDKRARNYVSALCLVAAVAFWL